MPPAAPTGDKSRLAPLAPERFGLQVTIGRSTQEKLRYAQSLLGLGSGDLAALLDQALDALIERAEKRKFSATTRPHAGRRMTSTDSRRIPAQVKREVWKRDQGRCTFTSDSGHRCEARAHLEFDHVEPVARGGESSLANVRLRCRAHNQLEAERVFGAGFMHEKRESRRTTQARRAVVEHVASLGQALV
jgi:5-methylcytosine-specific restriction endonuclease McrA